LPARAPPAVDQRGDPGHREQRDVPVEARDQELRHRQQRELAEGAAAVAMPIAKLRFSAHRAADHGEDDAKLVPPSAMPMSRPELRCMPIGVLTSDMPISPRT